MAKIETEVYFIRLLNVCTLNMHLHYCNSKNIFLIFSGWRLLVTVSKLPSVLQSWRLSSKKDGSWNITGQAKGKASGRAWKCPSGRIILSFFFTSAVKASPKFFDFQHSTMAKGLSVQLFVQQDETLRKTHIWSYKSKGFHPIGIQMNGEKGNPE